MSFFVWPGPAILNMVQEETSEPMIRNQSFILELPPEILLEIYTLVIGTCGSTQQSYDIYRLGKSPISLDLLLVNRKIYAEARLLPFQLTVFNFNQWNGTGIQYCNSFLRRICEWQAREIRHISLGVVGVNVDRWKDNGFVDICRIVDGTKAGATGLRSLRLSISGCLAYGGEKVFDVGAPWVTEGLGKLRALQSLEIIIVGDGADRSVLDAFKEALQHVLPGSRVAVQMMQRRVITSF
jgi:hypothetical protein